MKPQYYLAVFVVPALAALGLFLSGPWVWMAVVLVFGLIPLAELVLPAPESNPNREEQAERLANRGYDFVVYLALPVQVGLLLYYLTWVPEHAALSFEFLGAMMAVGLGCGGLGINIGHELGHRQRPFEQWLSKVLLGTSLYAHFFIEHNRGHHARVATEDDPATARRGEWIYAFWIRSMIGGWISAWALESERLTRRNEAVVSWRNEMLRLQVFQALAVALVWLAFGGLAVGAFIGAAIVGMLLLETVNYLEHYGLRRAQQADGRWARVRPQHSWNSNCILGRLLLFELTRHSDHHAHPKRPYPLLRHFDEAPELPTGYPGMIMVALLPPVFFRLMDPRIPEQVSPWAAQAA